MSLVNFSQQFLSRCWFNLIATVFNILLELPMILKLFLLFIFSNNRQFSFGTCLSEFI